MQSRLAVALVQTERAILLSTADGGAIHRSTFHCCCLAALCSKGAAAAVEAPKKSTKSSSSAQHYFASRDFSSVLNSKRDTRLKKRGLTLHHLHDEIPVRSRASWAEAGNNNIKSPSKSSESLRSPISQSLKVLAKDTEKHHLKLGILSSLVEKIRCLFSWELFEKSGHWLLAAIIFFRRKNACHLATSWGEFFHFFAWLIEASWILELDLFGSFFRVEIRRLLGYLETIFNRAKSGLCRSQNFRPE